MVRVESLSDKEGRWSSLSGISWVGLHAWLGVRLNPTRAGTRFSISYRLLAVAHDSKFRNNYNTINDEAVTLAKLLYSVAQSSL